MRTFFILVFLIVNDCIANTNDIYSFNWLDDNETVYVLQNKEFPKHSRFGTDVHFYDSASSIYQKTYVFSIGLVYNFSETFSIDATYKQYQNSNNTDLKNLLSLDDGTKPLIRKIDSAQLIHLNWIPFYGKVNSFNQIYYFDWGLGAGLGSFESQSNYQTFTQKNIPLTFSKETLLGFNLKSFFRIYMTDHFNLGFQYDLSGFNAITDSQKTESIVTYNELSIFLGYLF